jgi:glutamate synthase (ferredoxin)
LEGKSDSASMDMVIELFNDRTFLTEAMMMVVLKLGKNTKRCRKIKAFYEYNACIMEP